MYTYFIQIAILAVLTSMISFHSAEAQQLSEQEKIEYLISHVENLTDAAFVRNGTIHTPERAAGHMRTKLRRARRHISTAEDFIRICASQSSITGRKYLITFTDGRSVESGTYLKKILEELENPEHEVTD